MPSVTGDLLISAFMQAAPILAVMTQLAETLFPDLQPCYRTRVYFGLGDNGQVKIGITGRPSGRRGGEMHFTELYSVPGDRKTEDLYHDRYAAERIGRTEWFRLSDRLLIDLITECTRADRVKACETLKDLILRRLQLAAA